MIQFPSMSTTKPVSPTTRFRAGDPAKISPPRTSINQLFVSPLRHSSKDSVQSTNTEATATCSVDSEHSASRRDTRLSWQKPPDVKTWRKERIADVQKVFSEKTEAELPPHLRPVKNEEVPPPASKSERQLLKEARRRKKAKRDAKRFSAAVLAIQSWYRGIRSRRFTDQMLNLVKRMSDVENQKRTELFRIKRELKMEKSNYLSQLRQKKEYDKSNEATNLTLEEKQQKILELRAESQSVRHQNQQMHESIRNIKENNLRLKHTNLDQRELYERLQEYDRRVMNENEKLLAVHCKHLNQVREVEQELERRTEQARCEYLIRVLYARYMDNIIESVANKTGSSSEIALLVSQLREELIDNLQ
jgi:hypothetical protein